MKGMDRSTILAVFAHPDDEIGVGSTLAHYAGAGVRIVLVCASRGEAATIYCDECATRENLAEVRTHELECACAHLGVPELRWLDWPDGGIATLPRGEAVGRVVALIREVRPQVIITHPENGLYPHPDHLAVWEITRAAFHAAADPEEYPEQDFGPAWAADRLFTRVMPQSVFDASPEFAAYRVQLNGQQLPFLGTPDDQIDVVMRVAPWAERRLAAWDCHRSQHNPEGAFSQMPESLRRSMAENETFVLPVARVPLPERGAEHSGGADPEGIADPNRVADDLLAGLPAGSPQISPAGLDVAALQADLAGRRAYLAVCEGYLRHVTDPAFAEVLQQVAEQELEIIYLLARALRQAGESAAEIAPDPAPAARGAKLETIGDRQGFLLAGARQALEAWGTRATAATEPGERAHWEELRALAEDQVRMLTTLRRDRSQPTDA
jgi:LmbE family N-acetylglucosaminyl deacetylase